jgi:hypothetical protein
MAQHFSNETLNVLGGTYANKADGRVYQAKQRRIRASITMASQADGDTIVLGKLPQGARFAGLEITVSASTGSATLAVGVPGTPAKYKAAGAVTTTNVPQPFGLAAAMAQDPLAAEETVIATIGGAALPSSGTLVFDLLYTTTAS